jgi:hypothetical protein
MCLHRLNHRSLCSIEPIKAPQDVFLPRLDLLAPIGEPCPSKAALCVKQLLLPVAQQHVRFAYVCHCSVSHVPVVRYSQVAPPIERLQPIIFLIVALGHDEITVQLR